MRNGGKFLDSNTIIGGFGNKFIKQADGTFVKVGPATPDEILRSGVTVRPEPLPKITLKDHYEHHKAMVEDMSQQLREKGYTISEGEASFGSSCGVGRCRPDITAKDPSGKYAIFEVKTGDAKLSIRQTEIYPQIRNGDAIPRGDVARQFGLKPGLPLKDQGYPNGIPIIELHYPGAGK